MTRDEAKSFTERIFATTEPLEIIREVMQISDNLPPPTEDVQAMGAIVMSLMGLHLHQVAENSDCPVGVAVMMQAASMMLMPIYAPMMMACIRVSNEMHSALGDAMPEEAGDFNEALRGLLSDEEPPTG